MKRKIYNGFTIVETSLVIAIAGLIFLMVFVALPTLQVQARDSQRRDDMLMFINKLKNYQASNNRGSLPSGTGGVDGSKIFTDAVTVTAGSWGDFYKKFFNDSFTDPSSSTPYSLKITMCSGTKTGTLCNVETADFTISVVVQATCNGSDAVYSQNQRNAAVVYELEGGDRFCANT